MAKPLTDNLTLDNLNLKIIRENKQKLGSLSILKKSFFGQLFNNVKANWLMLIFCIPAAIWIIFSQINQVSMDMTIPYSGNLGIGYPVINDAHIVGANQDFLLAMRRALIMMPLIIVGSIGLAGVFNVVKYLGWSFEIKIIKTFFRGVKNSFAPFLWVGMMLAICFVLISLVFNVFNVYTYVHIAWKVTAFAITILFCLFVLLLSLFITTQASVFDLGLMDMIKNSFIFAIKFVLQNVVITIAGLVSMVLPFLTFNPIVQMISYILFFMLSFSWLATIWTLYTHYIYDMMYIDKPKNPTPPPQPQQTQKKKSTTKAPYQNPKKKRKQG